MRGQVIFIHCPQRTVSPICLLGQERLVVSSVGCVPPGFGTYADFPIYPNRALGRAVGW
jgi:hypothetical protein